MALRPFRPLRVFNDPFDPFFDFDWDFYDPFFDSHFFPMSSPFWPPVRWINRPQQMTHSFDRSSTSSRSLQSSSQPPNQDKFQVQLNVDGFKPESIRTLVDGRKVVIEAKEEDRQGANDYTVHEIRRTYELPEHADSNQLTSYVTSNNMLVVEVPVRKSSNDRQLAPMAQNDGRALTQFNQNRDSMLDRKNFLEGADFTSRIVDRPHNVKQLELTAPVKNYKPEEITVSVRGNHLVVQGQHKHEDQNRSERSSFYKSTTLPQGVQVDLIQAFLSDDGQLLIEAPFRA